jgi:ribosomal protein S28E/S33
MESIIEVLERSPPVGECFKVKVEVLTVVLMMIHIFWDVTQV